MTQLAVHARITEGSKSRIQIFKGVVIAQKELEKLADTLEFEKLTNGIGVERVFPFHCPNVEKIEIVQRGKTGRSKLYYLRDRSGKSQELKSITIENKK